MHAYITIHGEGHAALLMPIGLSQDLTAQEPFTCKDGDMIEAIIRLLTIAKNNGGNTVEFEYASKED